jgi:hypothetical protein
MSFLSSLACASNPATELAAPTLSVRFAHLNLLRPMPAHSGVEASGHHPPVDRDGGPVTCAFVTPTPGIQGPHAPAENLFRTPVNAKSRKLANGEIQVKPSLTMGGVKGLFRPATSVCSP